MWPRARERIDTDGVRRPLRSHQPRRRVWRFPRGREAHRQRQRSYVGPRPPESNRWPDGLRHRWVRCTSTFRIHDAQIDDATIEGKLAEGIGRFTRFEVSGPAIAGHGSGHDRIRRRRRVGLRLRHLASRSRAASPQTGGAASGVVATAGHLTGPYSALRSAEMRRSLK